ncbi:MAG: adenosylcobinamide-GDP ribazoletransferase, partial [Propionibacteriaceae bacterium]|nr:adenosylcobinamide-GDP ribazoletransferase [Propionibacteriaceae bacterium]
HCDGQHRGALLRGRHPDEAEVNKLHPLVWAAGFFSIIPVPPLVEVEPVQARRALAWLPTLGLLIGILAGIVGAVVALVSQAQLLAAALAVVAMQGLVGAMHLDGLADTADGLAALGSRKDGRDTPRALEIMRQPDVGAIGVVTIVATLLLQTSALASSPDAASLLVLVTIGGFLGRATVLSASRRGVPSARPGGFGALFADTSSPAIVGAHYCTAALLAGGCGWWLAGLPGALGLISAAIIAVSAAELWTRRLVRVFGGVTGDVFGALVEVTTTIWLVSAAIVLAAP